jgi:hypothetical protein
MVRYLVAHVSKLSNTHRFNTHNSSQKHPLSGNNQGSSIPTPNYPPWMIVPPQHPAETKLVDCHLYTWCTKCRQGQGLWVCCHNTETQIEGFTNNRHQKRWIECMGKNYAGVQYTTNPGNTSFHPPPHGSPAVPRAQLSLLDYLDEYLPEDESHSQLDDS